MTLGALSTITYYHIVLLINLSSPIQMSNFVVMKASLTAVEPVSLTKLNCIRNQTKPWEKTSV